MFIVINSLLPRYFCLRTGFPASDLAGAMWYLYFATVMCTLECLSECSVVSDSLWPTRMIALQALLSMGFPRQAYWSGLPRPSPGDLPDPGIERTSPASPALAGRFFTTAPPGKPADTSCQHFLLTQIFEEIRTGTWKSELGFWRGTDSSLTSLTFSLQTSGHFQRVYNLFCSEYKTKQNEKSWERPNKICHNST